MNHLLEFRKSLDHFVRAYWIELSIFAIALFVRFLLIAIAPGQELSTYWLGADGKDYAHEALNILQGHGFSRSAAAPFLPDTLKTPLYPLFLVAVHLLTGNFVFAVLFQAVFASFIPLIALKIARFFISDSRVLLVLGLFLALEPHLAFSTTFFGTEAIAVVLIAWGTYEITALLHDQSRPRAVRAGIAFGLATLARPITLYLPLFLLPLFWYQGLVVRKVREYLINFGIFCLVLLVVLSPWIMRNYAVFGTFSVSSASWFNLYTRLGATVVAIDIRTDFYTSFHARLDDLSRDGYIAHPPPVTEMEIEDPGFAPILRQETLKIFRAHPRALVIYLLTVPFSVLTQSNILGYISSFRPVTAFGPPFSPTLYISQHGPLAFARAIAPYLAGWYILPYLARAFLLVLFILSAVGAVILFRRGERAVTFWLFGLIVYFVLLTASAGAQITDRHRAPFLPVEAVLAAVALEALVHRRTV